MLHQLAPYFSNLIGVSKPLLPSAAISLLRDPLLKQRNLFEALREQQILTRISVMISVSWYLWDLGMPVKSARAYFYTCLSFLLQVQVWTLLEEAIEH